MQLIDNIGKVHRIIYFVAGLAAILYAWIAHDLLSIPEIVALVMLGFLLLWAARHGCTTCSVPVVNTAAEKGTHGES